MDEKTKIAPGIWGFMGTAREYTPISVSANFAALKGAKDLASAAESFEGRKKVPGKQPNRD